MNLLFLMEGWNLLPVCFFFGDKNGSSSLKYFYKKPYQTWLIAVKVFKKQKDAPARTHKESKYYYVEIPL